MELIEGCCICNRPHDHRSGDHVCVGNLQDEIERLRFYKDMDARTIQKQNRRIAELESNDYRQLSLKLSEQIAELRAKLKSAGCCCYKDSMACPIHSPAAQFKADMKAKNGRLRAERDNWKKRHAEMSSHCDWKAERIAELESALRHYANRDMWRKEVIDSYSGECDFFDWDGDLADEPWEIAEQALKEGDDGR